MSAACGAADAAPPPPLLQCITHYFPPPTIPFIAHDERYDGYSFEILLALPFSSTLLLRLRLVFGTIYSVPLLLPSDIVHTDYNRPAHRSPSFGSHET
jgi:hypothetical protein